MAKAQAAARFMTEVAPPQLVSIMRRRKAARKLDTITEDDRELPLETSLRRALPARDTAGSFMRELSKCFAVHGGQECWDQLPPAARLPLAYALPSQANGEEAHDKSCKNV